MCSTLSSPFAILTISESPSAARHCKGSYCTGTGQGPFPRRIACPCPAQEPAAGDARRGFDGVVEAALERMSHAEAIRSAIAATVRAGAGARAATSLAPRWGRFFGWATAGMASAAADRAGGSRAGGFDCWKVGLGGAGTLGSMLGAAV